MALSQPYLLFLGDAQDVLTAKTAYGIAMWRPELCVGEHRYADCGTSVGLPVRPGTVPGASTSMPSRALAKRLK